MCRPSIDHTHDLKGLGAQDLRNPHKKGPSNAGKLYVSVVILIVSGSILGVMSCFPSIFHHIK